MIRDSCRLCGKRFEPRHAEPLLEFVRPYYPEFQQRRSSSSARFPLHEYRVYRASDRFDRIVPKENGGGGRGEAKRGEYNVTIP